MLTNRKPLYGQGDMEHFDKQDQQFVIAILDLLSYSVPQGPAEWQSARRERLSGASSS
jgi:hypothetical protein